MPVMRNKPETPAVKQPTASLEKKENTGVLQKLETDDLILIAVVAILLMNNCDDKLLLIAIAFVFFSDYFK